MSHAPDDSREQQRVSLIRGVLLGVSAGYCTTLAAMTIGELFHGLMLPDILWSSHHQLVALLFGSVGGLVGARLARGRFQKEAAERAMASRGDFLSTLLDAVPIPLFYKDRSGRYLGANQAFEEFVGRDADQILGRTVHDMGPEDIADRYASKDAQLFQHPGTQVYEWLVQRGEQTRQVVFHKATFRDVDGEVAGLVGAIQDITEVKRAEEILAREVARHQVFVRSQGGMGLLRISRADEVLSANRRFAEILGYKEPEDLVGQHVESLWDNPRRWASLVASGDAAAGSVYRIEELRDSHGQVLRVGCSVLTSDREIACFVSEVSPDEYQMVTCASCHRFRRGGDSDQAWVTPAELLRESMDEIKDPTRSYGISHSICPECASRLYPQLVRKASSALETGDERA